jgi:hypothetical protein
MRFAYPGYALLLLSAMAAFASWLVVMACERCGNGTPAHN